MIESGPGWRWGYSPENSPFVALVGSDTWAVELTRSEWEVFCKLLPSLLATIALTEEELSDQENFTCELDSDHLLLQAFGYPNYWQLRLELRSGRKVEGFWQYPAMVYLWQKIEEKEAKQSCSYA